VKDSDLHRMIDAYQDDHAGDSHEDSTRAYFAGRMHQDWPAPGWLPGTAASPRPYWSAPYWPYTWSGR